MGILLPGQEICSAEGHVRGHGTTVFNDNIVSAHYGKKRQINKLITVSPCYAFKYTPEIGDVVVGRVVQIYNKKWKIETNSKTDTTLSLSAINLPGVMQRRKSEEDEINMRNFFDVGDLIVCEVQKVAKSGAAALHTRNEQYGRLESGVLVVVPQFLLLPLKTKFLEQNGVGVIVGTNGYIWITAKAKEKSVLRRVADLKNRIHELATGLFSIDVEELLRETA